MPSPYRLSDRTANLSAPSVSQTITSHETHHPISPVTLHLRGAHPPRRRIQWAEDVVDNEGMGKKSSKVCCIYHAPRTAGESPSDSESDSSSSSSSSDSDGGSEGNDDGGARMGGKGKERRREQVKGGDNANHQHQHTEEATGYGDGEQEHNHSHGYAQKSESKNRAKKVNAYEKVPKRQGGGGTVVKVERGCSG